MTIPGRENSGAKVLGQESASKLGCLEWRERDGVWAEVREGGDAMGSGQSIFPEEFLAVTLRNKSRGRVLGRRGMPPTQVMYKIWKY